LWPVLAVGGISAVPKRWRTKESGTFLLRAPEKPSALRHANRSRRSSVGGTYLQVVDAFLYTSACRSNRSAPASPTLVVLSQRRRASARLILPCW
jgi:hypothetical protein